MMNPGIWVLGAVFGTALIGCMALIVTQRWHGRLSLDHDLNGVQKIHRRPVPRVGGVAVFAALLVGGLGALWVNEPLAPQILALLFCSLPAFLAGLLEDLTKRVGVRARLCASFAAAALSAGILNAILSRVNTPGLDYFLTFAPVAVVFTCFAVGGVTNAINIIDGINGLAAGSVVLMLAGLSAMAWRHEDILVLELCLIGVAALIGFMILNFPGGRIFLGDGGAYLAGFWLAECAVLLLSRNPKVSTWAVLLVCFYPVWETIFSMYRRQIIGRVNSGQPDLAHLHHLVMRRLHNKKSMGHRPGWLRHGISSIVIWGLVILCQAMVLVADQNTISLMLGALIFATIYYCTYRFLAHENESQKNSTQIVKA